MDLNTVWFILIAVLFIGFFFLEGFDYGVGMLLALLPQNDSEKRVMINTIGPVWDGNEVWMLTAGGALFAAFPHVYATLFSGAYLALVLMLLALIIRGVAFEFRSKEEDPAWRSKWDTAIIVGSFLPALLWGVASSDLLYGMPIDEQMAFRGGFFSLLNPFSLAGGLLFVAVFAVHGAVFLALKTSGDLSQRAESMAKKLWPVGLVLYVVWIVLAALTTDAVANAGARAVIPALVAAVAYLLARVFLAKGRQGWAFSMTSLTVIAAVIALFGALYPRIIVSRLNPDWSLTIYNASSSQYTLKAMTIVALLLVPIVLVYQAWTYWVFRQRLSVESHLEY